jgi:competence protein ComEA
VPGIGRVIANKILAYRKLHGDFKTLDQLAEVSGYGYYWLQRVKPWIEL